MKLLIAGLCLLLTLPAAIAAPVVSVASAPPAVAAEPIFSWVPEAGYPDPFPYGQCTWWAAHNRRVSWGGNAADWLANAGDAGLATAQVPSLGAIAVYRAGAGYSEFGHVAVVVAVSGSAYTVSEMNYAGWAVIDTRTAAWPDPHLAGFIPLPGGGA